MPWFQYAQLQHLFQQSFSVTPLCITLTTFEFLLKNSDQRLKGKLSILYKILLQPSDLDLSSYSKAWSRDLHTSLNNDSWLKSRAISIKIQFLKLISHCYYTPLRLHYLPSSSSPLCWKIVDR